MNGPLPPFPLLRAIGAANAGHTDSFLGCFTSDAVVYDGVEYRGTDAIRTWYNNSPVGRDTEVIILRRNRRTSRRPEIRARIHGPSTTRTERLAVTFDDHHISSLRITP